MGFGLVGVNRASGSVKRLRELGWMSEASGLVDGTKVTAIGGLAKVDSKGLFFDDVKGRSSKCFGIRSINDQVGVYKYAMMGFVVSQRSMVRW